jgi:hypothetical protein
MCYRQKCNCMTCFTSPIITGSLNNDAFSTHTCGKMTVKSEYGSTYMEGSVRNLSFGSNTGMDSVTVHEPEALIALLVGSLDRITVELILFVLSCTHENSFHLDSVHSLPYLRAHLAEKTYGSS